MSTINVDKKYILPVVAIASFALGIACTYKKKRTRRKREPGSNPVRIYLMRHAQTTNNVRSNIIRSEGMTIGDRDSDPGLTEVGVTQSHAASTYLRDNNDVLKIKTVYCSPMRKALATLTPIAEALVDKNISSRVHMDIFEHGGIYNGEKSLSAAERAKLEKHYGLNWSEMSHIVPRLKFDETYDARRYFSDWGPSSDRGWFNGVKETPEQYLARINRIADWLYTLNENTLLVTHGRTLDSLIKCLIQSGTDLEIENTFFFTHGGCGLTCLELREEKAALFFVNDNILPMDSRTGHNLGLFRYLDHETKRPIRYVAQL